MLDRLLQALVATSNEAADDLLLQALAIGNDAEKAPILEALLKRQTVRGLSGIVASYVSLADPLKLRVLKDIKKLHPALRECGRSPDLNRRKAALKLIALGRQGKLAYVLSENLHDQNEEISKSAVDALVGLARWVAMETKRLQAGLSPEPGTRATESDETPTEIYNHLIEQRPEIEQAVARAMDVHRGKHGQELLRASLLLCDWTGSKTLGILQTTKHGGQSPMVRRLQQPPASEHVDAFLLGASHGQLRSHFGTVFSHIDEAPVLDALLRRTHWLKDHQLALCVHQVTRGKWLNEEELMHDAGRRDPLDAAKVGEWIATTGVHDVVQDDRLFQIYRYVKDNFDAKLRLLRICLRRPQRGASVALLKEFLTDSDERLLRIAAREIVRRRPPDFENMLIQLMTGAPESVRRVIARSIGQTGFDHFWQKFDWMDKSTRKNAGKAMLKVLPDAITRLGRKLLTGPLPERLKAMQIAHELELAEPLKPIFVQLCSDPNARIRSKAVMIVGTLPAGAELIVDRVLQDTDARVRANAIEVLEQSQKPEYLPLLAQRARSSSSRERANAIKALHHMKVKGATQSLQSMLGDDRPEHRISAMWALRQIGWWQLLNQVGNLAKADGNLRVRRYALTLLKGVAEMLQEKRNQQGQEPPQAKAG
jgi:HEAT repeat protein